MEFVELIAERDSRAWRDLFRRSVSDFTSFRGFELQHLRLFRGDYLLLKRRMKIRRFGVLEGRRLMAVALHFTCADESLGPASSLGGLLFDPAFTGVEFFAQELSRVVDHGTLAPYNGHMAIGLSHLSAGADPSKVSFLCAGSSRQLEKFFLTGAFTPDRKLYALETLLTPELRAKVDAGVADSGAKGFATRPLSLLHFKRDVRIFNSIVNAAMAHHKYFYPLTFEEEWDVMKASALLWEPSLFQFMMHEGKEIGFCFAIPDYNQFLSNERSDTRNVLEIIWRRLSGRLGDRPRLIYSAVLPEYQGQGLFKAVRYRVIQEMYARGATHFESSYVDEANAASLGNVKSTGGSVSHTFELFRTI